MMIFFIILFFFILLLLGMNVGSVLLITGILGIYLFGDIAILTNMLQTDIFTRVASYSLTTIPLFILMSQFFIQSGIVKEMYILIYNYSRGKSGVLGALTIVLGGILGSVSGSGTASSAALGHVSVPELRKHGFKDDLSGAIAATGGALSGIIPPSIILILYGASTQTAINKLFIAAIIPGIILTILFIIMVLIVHKYQQNKSYNNAPPGFEKKEIPLKNTIVTITASVLIILIIFMGIYLGVFTATEAGAVGAFVSMLAVISLGKFNFRLLSVSLVETIKVTGMVMFIMIGAQIFARFISLANLPRVLISLMEPLLQSEVLVILILVFVYFLLFMFLEGAAVIVMTVPLTLPIITEAAIDPIWFGVIVGITATIGLLTPPVGLSVFTVSGVSKIPIHHIFKHTFTFSIISLIIILALLFLFPGLATMLPNNMN